MLNRFSQSSLRLSSSLPPAIFRSYVTTAKATTTEPTLTAGEKSIRDVLVKELSGANVQVQDVSGGCGSFYSVAISHPSFKGLSTIKQHRLVNALLAEQIKGMHGIQLKTSAE